MNFCGDALPDQAHQPVYHVSLDEGGHHNLLNAALLQECKTETLQHRTILLLLEDLSEERRYFNDSLHHYHIIARDEVLHTAQRAAHDAYERDNCVSELRMGVV